MTHICVSNLTVTCSDKGFSPGRREAIIWNNVGILLIGPLGINFCEIFIVINSCSLKKMHLKKSSAKWRPFCPGSRQEAYVLQCIACNHYCDVIIGTMASQITRLTIVYSTVYSDADQRKYQSSASLAGEFAAQMASNADNVSILWRHHAKTKY